MSLWMLISFLSHLLPGQVQAEVQLPTPVVHISLPQAHLPVVTHLLSQKWIQNQFCLCIPLVPILYLENQLSEVELPLFCMQQARFYSCSSMGISMEGQKGNVGREQSQVIFMTWKWWSPRLAPLAMVAEFSPSASMGVQHHFFYLKLHLFWRAAGASWRTMVHCLPCWLQFFPLWKHRKIQVSILAGFCCLGWAFKSFSKIWWNNVANGVNFIPNEMGRLAQPRNFVSYKVTV